MMLDDLKRWYRVRDGYWFAPKLFGFGATPVTWQGWALTFAYLAAMILMVQYLPGDVPRIAVGVALTVLLIVAIWRKTDGDWRWRWGSRD